MSHHLEDKGQLLRKRQEPYECPELRGGRPGWGRTWKEAQRLQDDWASADGLSSKLFPALKEFKINWEEKPLTGKKVSNSGIFYKQFIG